ncbi:hypothetical protein M422DRAFT_33208 [Sphaerobolus stellatus SS14]|uniref:Uncharacterized protein n=1 Tax=Sphaerobolus stellatus (strain SS14) TaxID=990650 RepID=A0A0C9VLU8_SPHS4|nr:hypothetical protein M422DRAFT_33208 [Sphaerobolus stellatus SS14]
MIHGWLFDYPTSRLAGVRLQGTTKFFGRTSIPSIPASHFSAQSLAQQTYKL